VSRVSKRAVPRVSLRSARQRSRKERDGAERGRRRVPAGAGARSGAQLQAPSEFLPPARQPAGFKSVSLQASRAQRLSL